MAFSVADWFSVKLDERVSVSFPGEPMMKDSGGNPMWVHEGDSISRYMALVIDFEKLGMDSAMLASEMGKPETFEQFKNGVLSQMSGASLISEKQSVTEGRHMYEYVFDMGKKDSNEFNIMHNRNIFIGSKMYSLSFFEKTNKPQEDLRNKFFTSLKTAY
jgi:hypothetical protein